MGSVSRDEAKVVTDKLSPEQKKQAEGFVDGATNVATGVAGTAGGAVKGVLDTAGNTVGLLILFIGSGLAYHVVIHKSLRTRSSTLSLWRRLLFSIGAQLLTSKQPAGLHSHQRGRRHRRRRRVRPRRRGAANRCGVPVEKIKRRR